ncbi:MAG: type IV pilus biogenesis/stability protein PilW [Woeseiaceae bacterium]|nr:type IV pilus biogenesis/stability protein PilW [Woeseiaceae bacterium]
MNRRTIATWGVLGVICLLAGCVSSTSGSPRTEPSDEEAAKQYYQLGARYYRNGSYELARDRLQRAIELNPRLALAHTTLALTYQQLDNVRLAEAHYQRSVQAEPGSVNARNAYAVFLCQQRRFDEADEQFRRAKRGDLNDRAEIMLTNAGVCMAQKPDLERAEAYFREALDYRPNYGEALLQMAILKRQQEENLLARAFLQRYLGNNRATPELLWLAVEIERDIGDERAVNDYENRLLREFPQSDEARRVLQGG